MLVNDIETLLNAFTFTSGGTTFLVRRGGLPNDPDAVIAIEAGAGMKPVRGMGASGGNPIFDRPAVDIKVRGPVNDYIAANDVADQVMAKLDHVASTLNGRRYYIQALFPPQLEDHDKNDRWVLLASYLVHKERG